MSCILCILLLIISVTGCGNDQNTGNTEDNNQKEFVLREDMKGNKLQYFSMDGVKINFPETLGDLVDSFGESAKRIKIETALEYEDRLLFDSENPDQQSKIEADSTKLCKLTYYRNDSEYHTFSVAVINDSNKSIFVTDAPVQEITFYSGDGEYDEYFSTMLKTIVINDEIRMDSTYKKEDLIAYLGEDNVTLMGESTIMFYNGRGLNYWYFQYDKESDIINQCYWLWQQ